LCILFMVQLGNQFLSLMCITRHSALVLEHSERHQFQSYTWKRVYCPWTMTSATVSALYTSIHTNLLSVVYFVLQRQTSNVCLMPTLFN